MLFDLKIIVAILLIIVIIFTLCINSNNYILPYNHHTVKSNEYFKNEEGFQNISNNSMEYSSYPANNSIDFGDNNEINKQTNNCYKLTGHSGVYCSANTTPNNPTDIFGKSNGSLNAPSYGLMNSRGYLILDNNQRSLYTSRGGNATGGNGDIGSSV
jgi:hypothetical protein